MRKILLILFTLSGLHQAMGQIAYQSVESKNLTFGSYGRIGIDRSLNSGGSVGRRLNLNNMGSIGGRLEEQDYLELATALHFSPFRDEDSTQINVHLRLSAYSASLSLIGNTSTASSNGLVFALPEMYAEVKNIANSGLNLWVGNRLYRGKDLHINDYYFFNDHSGQGFGLEYKHTRFATLAIASTDTTSTVPPYFYLNIATGTPSLALRQRHVYILEQDFIHQSKHTLTALAEAHFLSPADPQNDISSDTSLVHLNYPADYGLVFGLRWFLQLPKGNYNQLALRYGNRIANGGDGGLSRTWLTYGAPHTDKQNFAGALAISFVEELLLNTGTKNTLNPYLIFHYSKGAANSDSTALTYWGKEVYNRKQDLSIGFRDSYYFSPLFHLLTEVHYTYRKDGTEDPYTMLKFSIAPTLSPMGTKDYWVRPHFRFVASLAHYNQAAMDQLYSPYLNFVGAKEWGHYLGIKAEWWL